MQTNRKLDLIAGIGFIAIAAIIIFIAIPYGVQEPKKVKFVALSPSYYPRLVCFCLLAFGVLLVITRINPTRILMGSNRTEVNNSNSDATSGIRLPIFMAFAATLLFYYFSLQTLGFIVSSSVVLLVLLLLAGERNAFAIVLLPLLLPLCLYWFFVKVANIPIPAGVLEKLLVG